MRIITTSQQECRVLLKRVSIGRLVCSLDDQPHVVPVTFSGSERTEALGSSLLPVASLPTAY